LYFGTLALLAASLLSAQSPLTPRSLVRNIPVIVYLAGTLLSLTNAQDLLLGIERFCQLGCCVVFYLWVQSSSDAERLRRIPVVVLVGAAVSAISFVHFVIPESSTIGYVAASRRHPYWQ
jgi:hypothetical protein